MNINFKSPVILTSAFLLTFATAVSAIQIGHFCIVGAHGLAVVEDEGGLIPHKKHNWTTGPNSYYSTNNTTSHKNVFRCLAMSTPYVTFMRVRYERSFGFDPIIETETVTCPARNQHGNA